jgi:indoleamine 2,3-dioxygenase
LAVLPERFGKLESLLQRMPIRCRDGSSGLLAHGQFGDAVNAELPVYNVDDIHDNQLLSGTELTKMKFSICHRSIHG